MQLLVFHPSVVIMLIGYQTTQYVEVLENLCDDKDIIGEAAKDPGHQEGQSQEIHPSNQGPRRRLRTVEGSTTLSTT